jgi:Ser/Thr protein kinase RdoA (MazF antagonist)
LNAEDALTLAERFGIDVRGAAVSSLAGGYSNESMRIDASSGSYVARRYGRLHVSRGAIAFEHVVIAHAARSMDEIVAPLRDAGGETIVVPASGGLASVSPFVAGETGRRDLATACAAARVLARFHRAVRDVHVASGLRTARFLGTLPWLRERFLRNAADSLVARKLDWTALVTATTAAAARVAPRAAELPSVIVHGDPNPDNVVAVEPGVVRGLIDFDFVHETERIYDVAALIDEFARTDDDAALDLARVRPLVAAYAEEAPLSATERATLPDALLRHAATLAWYVATRHGERTPGDVGRAGRYAARVAEIAGNFNAIRSAAE